MINLEINLLSPSKKAKLVSLIKFLFIKEYLELIVLVACFLGIAHLGAYYVLNKVVNDLSKSTILVNRDFSLINQEIRGVNALLKAVSNAGDQFVPISPWISDLEKILPHDVRLINLSVDRMEGKVVISGVASTRESLLGFIDKLSETEWVGSPTVPRSQLFLRENLPFEITATLKIGIIKDKKVGTKSKLKNI